MAKFPFVTDSITGGDVPINFYPAADSELEVVLHASPGLLTHCSLPECTEIREMMAWNNYLYVLAQRGSESIAGRVDTSGGFAELGTVPTSASGPAWIKHNATQICFVDAVSGYVYTPATNHFEQITDPDFVGASSFDVQDSMGLFVKPNSNYFYNSAINDFLSIASADFYQKSGSPDNIVSILSDHREPWLFGAETTEAFYNAGGANTGVNDVLFKRNSGGYLKFGCAAAKSPVDFDNSIAWLSDEGQMLKATGYNAQVFSSDMFGREIAGYSIISDAVAFSYTDKEHQFYQITFPSADKTWVFDAKTKLWHKKQSYKGGGEFGRHRANCYAFLNNTHYVGDYNNGKIYKMSTDYYDDAGEEIQRIIYSIEFNGGLKRIAFPSIYIEVKAGVGLESGLDPQIMLQFSKDSGATWSSELWRSAGLIGQTGIRAAIWHRPGSAYKRIYRATFTDPVEWQIRAVYGFN